MSGGGNMSEGKMFREKCYRLLTPRERQLEQKLICDAVRLLFAIVSCFVKMTERFIAVLYCLDGAKSICLLLPIGSS